MEVCSPALDGRRYLVTWGVPSKSNLVATKVHKQKLRSFTASLLEHTPPYYTSSTPKMTDAASGTADRSVQVKLVLLGALLSHSKDQGGLRLLTFCCAGEAAVGKSSVVLRFVSDGTGLHDAHGYTDGRPFRSITSFSPTRNQRSVPHF